MKPKTVVISLPVSNIDKSLAFYRDGLGVETSDIEGGMITIELPNLSLFLIQTEEFEKYSKTARVSAAPKSDAVEVILSCAFAKRQDVVDLLEKAGQSGGQSFEAAENSETLFMGYFRDPDGHLWELVWNEFTSG